MAIPDNDRFKGCYGGGGPGGVNWPYTKGRVVVPSNVIDTQGFPNAEVCRGLFIGSAGTIRYVIGESASQVINAIVAAGTLLKVRARRVNATGTTASNILALY